MAEMAALSMLAGGGTAAAAGGAAGVAGAGLSTGSLLSIAATGAGAFGSIMGGFQQSAALRGQAQQVEMAGRQKRINALDEANRIRRSFLEDLSSANAAFGVKGVLQGSGSAMAAIGQSARNATTDIRNTMFAGEVGARTAFMEGQQLRSDARAARTGGFMQAFTGIGNNKNIISLIDG